MTLYIFHNTVPEAGNALVKRYMFSVLITCVPPHSSDKKCNYVSKGIFSVLICSGDRFPLFDGYLFFLYFVDLCDSKEEM